MKRVLGPYEVEWTFKEWLEYFKDVDLPIGDLARDILADEEFPECEEYFELLEYVAGKAKYDSDVIDTFRTVWDFYQSTT